MGRSGYISLLNFNGTGSHVALFSASKGGETAGSIASSGFSYKSSYFGGETAGSVARGFSGGSSGCSFSSGSSSFSAIA